MPYFNLHTVLSCLHSQQNRCGRQVFVLQIGAMDGKTFDPIHPYITRFGWHGLMVEPVPEHFEVLQQTYAQHSNIRLVNAAIADHNGHTQLHYVPKRVIQQQQLPKWAAGLASLFTNRNAMAFEHIQPFIHTVQVPCLTLAALQNKHHLPQVDLLQVDTEGYDYHIVQQALQANLRPAVINMEFVNLPKAEQTACKKLLDAHRYVYVKGGYDLLAVSYEFMREWVT